MPDTCNGCGAVRPKWRQWYRALPPRRVGEPSPTAPVWWCPGCAPADLVAARTATKLANFAARRAP